MNLKSEFRLYLETEGVLFLILDLFLLYLLIWTL